MNQITSLKCSIIKNWSLSLVYIIQILQAGEYKLGSITVRAQLLRDHLRVEVSTNNHDNDLLIQDIFGEFFSIETICRWSTTSKVFLSNWWWCLDQRFNETSSQKGVERAPPEATWGAQGHLVREDGQGQQAQSKVQHQHDKVFAQGCLFNN